MSDLYRELPPTHAARAEAEARKGEPPPSRADRDDGILDLVVDVVVNIAGGIIGLMALVALVRAML